MPDRDQGCRTGIKGAGQGSRVPICLTMLRFKPGFHYTANAVTMTQKQSHYKVEQSFFMLIALF